MALCFAHSAAGYLAYELIRPPERHRPRLLAAAVLLANAPDLDFIPGLLVGAPHAFHRGVTHTVLAAVLVGAVALLLARRWRPASAWRVAGWAAATYGSHLLLDWLTVDVVPPPGAQFLWPISDAYYIAPVTPIPELVVDGAGRGAFLHSLCAPGTLVPWLADLSFLLAAVAAVHVVRLVRQDETEPEAVDRA